MLKRNHYIAWGAVVLIALLVLNLPSQTTSHLKLAIGSLFLPLFGLAGATQQASLKLGDSVLPRSELIRQIESLRLDNQRLNLQLIQDREIAAENARSRQSETWRRQSPWPLKPANVVLREPANWWRGVWIDRGSLDQIQTNLPVLTVEGLVGRVTSVGLTRSHVVLIGDPNCKVAALVQETRDAGIISGGGVLDSSLVEMNLFRNASLKPGQNVITSGQGGYFPKGIPIGKVVDTRPGEYGLYTDVRVQLAANLGALEQVWVLFPPAE